MATINELSNTKPHFVIIFTRSNARVITRKDVFLVFDKKQFVKRIKTVTLIAVFIFLLACINLFAKTNEQILTASSMEMAGYVGVYDDNYDELKSHGSHDLKIIAENLESDSAAVYEKSIYILDKESQEFFATQNVSQRIRDELTSSVNEKLIVIDSQTCKVVDFEHYKLLVKVNVLSSVPEFVSSIKWLAASTILTLLVAFLFIAVICKMNFKNEGIKTAANIFLTLAVVFAFAVQVLQAEMAQLEAIEEADVSTLQANLDEMCNNADNYQIAVADGLTYGKVETFGNSIAKASMTLKDVSLTSSSRQSESLVGSGNFSAAKDAQISKDEGKIQNETNSFWIQFALLILLAFILAKEMADREKTSKKVREKGTASLNKTDSQIRTVMMLVGLATSSFGIVNVLRIRQVVMLNFSGDVAGIISVIFTCTMVICIAGSFASSTILKKCGNIKTYVCVVCILGVAGSFACSSSDNLIVFIAGLLFYNVAHSTSRMSDDFYISVIEDPARKDLCGVEFGSSKTIGEVIGTIAGGIVSSVLSFAFVQMIVCLIFVCTVVYALRLKGKELVAKNNSEGGFKTTLNTALTAAKHPRVAAYMVLVAMVASVPYILVQFRLPLDIAALGLSAVVLSFVKTMREVFEIYSKPLFHIVGKRLSTTTHAVLYVALSGAVILIYMLAGGSLVVIAVSIAILGMLDGAGKYSITSAFRKMPELQEMPESDRVVALRLSQKAGDAVSPSLLSAFNNALVAPVIVIVLPIAYLFLQKPRN